MGINNFILPIITVVLCEISFLLILRDINENKLAYGLNEDSDNRMLYSKSLIIYSVAMTIVTVAASILFTTLYEGNDFFQNLKRMILLSILWPIAYTDFKTYRIPNAFILLGLIYRAVIIPLELLLFGSELVWRTLLSEVIAAVGLLIAAILCSVCIKNSIGYGDMKLFIIMGLLLSMDGIWSAILLSLLVSFFISVYLLITKKKTRKDSIPFAPAIVIGTFLSVCLTGM